MNSIKHIQVMNEEAIILSEDLLNKENHDSIDLIDKFVYSDIKKYKHQESQKISDYLNTIKKITLLENSKSLHILSSDVKSKINLVSTLNHLQNEDVLLLNADDLNFLSNIKNLLEIENRIIIDLSVLSYSYDYQRISSLLQPLFEAKHIEYLIPSLNETHTLLLLNSDDIKQIRFTDYALIRSQNDPHHDFSKQIDELKKNYQLFRLPFQVSSLGYVSILLNDEFRIEVMHRNLLYHQVLLFRNNNELYFHISQLKQKRIKEFVIQCFYQMA